ncbi:regulator of G-protein signaling 2 L homeolog [Xenopus laevis]|uniref:Regulator of G-protein signaling 2 n=1 Tax=Xenopus laevis TaxID=8355 RepID=Q5U532_XENLA|nr:regulator of G-protein signaling 2 L homeolog [Xenopus laevis]AAH84852.1 LOC495384 protein [Xenopus laevis]
MQSAMFLAIQHNCGPAERSSSGGCQKNEEKRGKMKKTILKDWKTRLSYFLQNSQNTNGSPTAQNKRGKKNAYCRPSPEEAKSWSETFDDLLASKYGVAAFRAFLKSEFSEENIEFWLACEDFKKTKSPHKLTTKAKKIYDEFIEKEAPKEINIDFQTRENIIQTIQEPSLSCFCAAQKRVYSLMENNSYPRFLQSEFYQELCQSVSQMSKEPQAT